ncbi:hypothetical protein P692DRAFT_20819463 [Suillus brevipes Sb2]|nr:hypothetical protein P692DRAFT_20819463 [Suillus brevipes Sb2]
MLPGSKLPVVVVSPHLSPFGLAFLRLNASTYVSRQVAADRFGNNTVSRSLHMHEPVIYVSLNYWWFVSVLHFLSESDVSQVERLGIPGEPRSQAYWHWKLEPPRSYKSISEHSEVIQQSNPMLAYDGDNEGLFRAAFMQSGSPTPIGDITRGQRYYDFIVDETLCKESSDALDCLRGVPENALQAAVARTPSFSSNQANNSSSAYWAPNATPEEIDDILLVYPEDPMTGSPFGTVTLNQLTPQFKRIAAFQGDSAFQAPRRACKFCFIRQETTILSVSKGLKAVPLLGAYHGSDFLDEMRGGPGSLLDHFIRFAAKLDPNGDPAGIFWPQYAVESKDILMIGEWPWSPPTIVQDTYRKEAIKFLMNFSLAHPLY